MGLSEKPFQLKRAFLANHFCGVADLRYCCTERIGTYNYLTKSLKKQAERIRNVYGTYRNV